MILDPLTAFITALTNPTAARAALDSLSEISRRTDTAILFIHHFTKVSRSDAFAAIAGAGAVTDLARAVYIYGPSDPDTAIDFDRSRAGLRVLACVKLSAAPVPQSLAFELAETSIPNLTTPVPHVQLLGETSISAENLFPTWMRAAARSQDRQTPKAEAETLLTELLAGGPRPSADVIAAADEAGIAPRTFARARSQLRIQSYQSHGRHWMRLPHPPRHNPGQDWQ